MVAVVESVIVEAAAVRDLQMHLLMWNMERHL